MITQSNKDLKFLSRSAKGDLRAALVDLQTSTEDNNLKKNFKKMQKMIGKHANPMMKSFKV